MCQCRTSPKPGKVCVFQLQSNDIINTNQESTSRSFESPTLWVPLHIPGKEHTSIHLRLVTNPILSVQSSKSQVGISMDAVTISVLPPYFWVDSASPWHFAQSRNDGYRSAEPEKNLSGFHTCPPAWRWTPILWDEGRKSFEKQWETSKELSTKRQKHLQKISPKVPHFWRRTNGSCLIDTKLFIEGRLKQVAKFLPEAHGCSRNRRIVKEACSCRISMISYLCSYHILRYVDNIL